MKTDDLIDMLASGPDVAVTRSPVLRNTALLLGALLLSGILMAATLGVRADLLAEAALPLFWLKVLFSLSLAGAGWVAVRRLSAPGAPVAVLPLFVAAPVVLIWLFAAMSMVQAAPEVRPAMFWGSTWRYCPVLIALMALPVFAATLSIMRQFAPTRLRLAGAAAGLASGGAAAAVYCLHCPELSATFVGVWYLLGMLAPTALGALLGPRVLAW